MSLWNRQDSIKGIRDQEKEKEQTLQTMEQAITDLELGNIERDIIITDLELAVLGLQGKNN